MDGLRGRPFEVVVREEPSVEEHDLWDDCRDCEDVRPHRLIHLLMTQPIICRPASIHGLHTPRLQGTRYCYILAKDHAPLFVSMRSKMNFARSSGFAAT
eukprot:scaffold492_cov257-Pinguiococcus_pyrenoidosus.AAC.33